MPCLGLSRPCPSRPGDNAGSSDRTMAPAQNRGKAPPLAATVTCHVQNFRYPRRCQAQYRRAAGARSEEHTSELQSLMRISYAVFCLKKKTSFISLITHTTIHNF